MVGQVPLFLLRNYQPWVRELMNRCIPARNWGLLSYVATIQLESHDLRVTYSFGGSWDLVISMWCVAKVRYSSGVLGTAKISPHTVFKCIRAENFDTLVSTAFIWVHFNYNNKQWINSHVARSSIDWRSQKLLGRMSLYLAQVVPQPFFVFSLAHSQWGGIVGFIDMDAGEVGYMVLGIWCGETVSPSVQNYWLCGGSRVLLIQQTHDMEGRGPEKGCRQEWQSNRMAPTPLSRHRMAVRPESSVSCQFSSPSLLPLVSGSWAWCKHKIQTLTYSKSCIFWQLLFCSHWASPCLCLDICHHHRAVISHEASTDYFNLSRFSRWPDAVFLRPMFIILFAYRVFSHFKVHGLHTGIRHHEVSTKCTRRMTMHLELAGSHKSSYTHNKYFIEYIVCIYPLWYSDGWHSGSIRVFLLKVITCLQSSPRYFLPYCLF